MSQRSTWSSVFPKLRPRSLAVFRLLCMPSHVVSVIVMEVDHIDFWAFKVCPQHAFCKGSATPQCQRRSPCGSRSLVLTKYQGKKEWKRGRPTNKIKQRFQDMIIWWHDMMYGSITSYIIFPGTTCSNAIMNNVKESKKQKNKSLKTAVLPSLSSVLNRWEIVAPSHDHNASGWPMAPG